MINQEINKNLFFKDRAMSIEFSSSFARHFDMTQFYVGSLVIGMCILSASLIFGDKPHEHLYTPSAPLYWSFAILLLSGALAGHLLETILGDEYVTFDLWIPALTGSVAFLVMSVSSYSLWGIASFGISTVTVLLLATQSFDKLVVTVFSIFVCSFVASLRGTEKKFQGSSVLYHAFGWALICGPAYIFLSESTHDMFIRGPAVLIILLIIGNLPDGEPRETRIWQKSTCVTISISVTLLVAFLKGGVFIYLAIIESTCALIISAMSNNSFKYGPFTSSERQAQVWLLVAFALVNFHAADFDGMKHSEINIRMIHIVAMMVGACASLIVQAIFVIGCAAHNPINSTQYRMLLLDLFSAFIFAGLPIVIALFSAYLNPPSFYNTYLQGIPSYLHDKMLYLIPDTTIQAVEGLTTRWAYCGICISLLHMMLTAQRLLAGSYPLWAPLLSETVYKCEGKLIAEKKALAITFDAGPHPQVTPKLMEVLKAYKAKATFFVRGHAATRWPGQIKNIADEGHQIESQCMAARDFNMFPGPIVRNEMNLANEVLSKQLKRKPKWIRNVFGFKDYRLHLHAARSGMRVAYWSVCPWDWEQRGVEKTLENILSQLDTNGGDIICLTETNGNFNEPNHSLPSLVDKLLDQLSQDGYTFVTLDTLAGENLEA